MRARSNATALRRARALSALLAAGLAALSACAAPRVSLRPSAHTFTADDYRDVLQRWTRSADDFDFLALGEILHVTATFESHEMRWAYVVRYAEDHSMTTEERSHLLERSLRDVESRHRFLVTLGTPIFREGDLTSEQSDWRVLLVDASGRQTEPVELLRVRRPSHDLRVYFPAIHRQRHVFRVAFPVATEDGAPTIDPSSDHVILRFASASGTVNLRWDLEAGAAAGGAATGDGG